jgi:hypothetical protein
MPQFFAHAADAGYAEVDDQFALHRSAEFINFGYVV